MDSSTLDDRTKDMASTCRPTATLFTRNGAPTPSRCPSSATSTDGIEKSSDVRRTRSAHSIAPLRRMVMARRASATTPNTRSALRVQTEAERIGTQRTLAIKFKTRIPTCTTVYSGTRPKSSNGLILNRCLSLHSPCVFTSLMLAWRRSSAASQATVTSPITTWTASRRQATT